MAKKADGLEIEAQVLASAMGHAARIAASTSTLAILANVRLIAAGDTLEITASDLDTELTRTVPLARGGELSLTVDARRLADMANAADAGAQMKLARADADRLEVKTGRSRWHLPALGTKDFPSVEFAPPSTIKVPGQDLAAAIGRVIDSVLTGKAAVARANFAGVYLHGDGGKLRMVAVDGNRVASCNVDAAPPEGAPGVIVLPKFLSSLVGLIGDDEAEIEIGWTDRRIAASGAGWRIVGKLIDQTFPDYQRIIPAAGEPTAIFDPEAMRRAIKRVRLMQERESRIMFTLAPDKIVLEAKDAGGTAEEELPAECSTEMTIALNGAYMAQAMQQVGGDTVRMQIGGPTEIARIERVVEDGMIALIMPMR